MPNQPIQIRGTLDRYEGHKAVLLLDDETLGPLTGQELVVPTRLLPSNLAQGAMIVVELMTDEQATQAREHVARKVLEEILNGQ